MRNAEQWKAFDLADWALDLLFAHYTRLIYLERQKPAPDVAQIAQWQQEQRTLHDESDALRFAACADVRRLLCVCQAFVRRLSGLRMPAMRLSCICHGFVWPLSGLRAFFVGLDIQGRQQQLCRVFVGHFCAAFDPVLPLQAGRVGRGVDLFQGADMVYSKITGV